jgi:hypothetical protein
MNRPGNPDDRWFDQAAGPVVRPYALTRGRTAPVGGTSFGLIDVVTATGLPPLEAIRLTPEHRRIMSLCHRPVPVVDLASDIDLPIGVVRVLLGDLVSAGLLTIRTTPRGPVTDQRLLRTVLHALQSL